MIYYLLLYPIVGVVIYVIALPIAFYTRGEYPSEDERAGAFFSLVCVWPFVVVFGLLCLFFYFLEWVFVRK